jgi:hypothetical protein
MANDGFIEFLSPNALAELKQAQTLVDSLALKIEQISKFKAPSTPSGVNSASKQIIDDLKTQQTTIESLKKQLADLTQQRRNEDTVVRSQILTKRELQRQVDAEIKSNLQAIGLYGRINSELNVLKNTYRDLALKKELGEQLNKREQESLTKSFDKLTKYDQALKKVDASMGVHGRSVGNYASGFNPLSNSISQITRELPNFGQSLQIGILSLTNNIGAFQDAIIGIKEQNKILQAEGQATKSVFAQVGAAFLSWNTLLYVGIGLLSAYGKEIGNWVSSLFSGSKALDELNKSQDEFNKKRLQSSAKTQQEVQNIKEYLKIAQNANKAYSADQVLVAFQKIREAGKYYFKDLKDSEIFTRKGAESLYQFTKAIEANAKAQDLLNANLDTNKRISELQAEIEARKKYEDERRSLVNDINKNKENPVVVDLLEKELELLNDSNDSRKERRDKLEDETLSIKNTSKIQNELNLLIEEEAKQRNRINKAIEGSIVLDYTEKKEAKNIKAKKEKIDLNFKEIESEYELKIAILETKKAENADNDQTSYEERIAKRIAFSEASIEIIDMQLQKEYALYEFKRNEDLAKNNLALKNKEISLEQHSINKDDIINTYINKSLTAEIKASDDIKALQKQDFNFFKSIKYKQQDEVLKLNKLITNGEIVKYKIIADNENKTLAVREAAFQAYIQLEKDLLEAQKISDVQRAESRGASKEEIAAITAEYENAIAALGNIRSPKMIAIEQVNAEMKQIAQSFAGDAGFGATFKLLSEGLDKYGDNVAAKTVVIMESFQEMFNFINQMSQENFEAEKQRLEEQTKIALAFAGESDTARAEIERQAEIRRKEIQRREFKAKKEQAIFNIGIDTAQAIISIWAQVPKVDFGVSAGLLSAFVGALGLAQIAMVQSQQIPAYKDGTDNHGGGAMLVNDGSGSNYKETIQTPDGKIYQPKERNVIMNAPKGTKVFTHDQWQRNLDNILTSNSIGYAQPNVVVNSGMSDSQVDRIVSTIQNKQESHLALDKNGIKHYVSNGHSTKEILNNQVTFGR